MARVGAADRLFAILLLVLGIYSFHRVYASLASGDGPSHPLDNPISLAVLFGVLLAGIFCTFGAWRFWNDPAPDTSSSGATEPAPLFGRGTGPRTARRSVPRAVLFMLPLFAVAVLAADRFVPRLTFPDIGNESPPGVEAQPRSTPDETAPADATSTEQAPSPTELPPQTEAAIPSPTQDVGTTTSPRPDTSGDEASWPQLTLAPELTSPPEVPPPATVAVPEIAPPRTTAPLPAPVQPPTQANGHKDAVVWLAVSPDGHTIMSASTDHTIKLWDADGKRLIRDLGAHKDMVRTALFLPDGARVLTAGDDGEIVLRSFADGAVLHVFSAIEHGGANKLAMSEDGSRAVSVHEAGTVIVWDIGKKTALHVLTGHDWSISGIAVSPDGTRAVSGSIDGTLKLWDIDSGRLLRTWHGHERGTYGAVFTTDGRQFLTGSGDYTIKLWDVETVREVRRFTGHSGTVYVLALSSDGKQVLSGSLDGTARLWDIASGNEVVQFVGNSGPIYAVAFAADGAILTGGIDRAIREWPASGGDAIALFPGAP